MVVFSKSRVLPMMCVAFMTLMQLTEAQFFANMDVKKGRRAHRNDEEDEES